LAPSAPSRGKGSGQRPHIQVGLNANRSPFGHILISSGPSYTRPRAGAARCTLGSRSTGIGAIPVRTKGRRGGRVSCATARSAPREITTLGSIGMDVGAPTGPTHIRHPAETLPRGTRHACPEPWLRLPSRSSLLGQCPPGRSELRSPTAMLVTPRGLCSPHPRPPKAQWNRRADVRCPVAFLVV